MVLLLRPGMERSGMLSLEAATKCEAVEADLEVILRWDNLSCLPERLKASTSWRCCCTWWRRAGCRSGGWCWRRRRGCGTRGRPGLGQGRTCSGEDSVEKIFRRSKGPSTYLKLERSLWWPASPSTESCSPPSPGSSPVFCKYFRGFEIFFIRFCLLTMLSSCRDLNIDFSSLHTAHRDCTHTSPHNWKHDR